MVSPPPNSRIQEWARHLRDKGRFLSQGGRDVSNSNQVGLFPKQGWQQRNVHFFRNVVIPSMFAKRGGTELGPLATCKVKGGVTVTWIGHATFLIQMEGKNILVDPNWAMWHSIFKRVRRPGIDLDSLPPIDLILVSHAHHDHLHRKSLSSIAQGQPILIPHGVGKLVSRYDLQPTEMDWWDEFNFGDIKITFTPAQHWGARYVHDLHRGFGGFMISSASGAVYHCGDSAYCDAFSEIGSRFEIDLALLPIGAYDAPSGRAVHMNPEEAIDALVELKANRMAPMHYGTFPLGGEPMHEPLERLVYCAGSRRLSHRVRILEEGKPETFRSDDA